MGQLKLKELETPISRWLFNESPRDNIFTKKTVGVEFFKPLLMLTNSYFYASTINEKGPKSINQQ
jgi:hypothetical protein